MAPPHVATEPHGAGSNRTSRSQDQFFQINYVGYNMKAPFYFVRRPLNACWPVSSRLAYFVLLFAVVLALHNLAVPAYVPPQKHETETPVMYFKSKTIIFIPYINSKMLVEATNIF